MDNFDHLIRKYGGGENTSPTVATPYDHLIRKFGSSDTASLEVKTDEDILHEMTPSVENRNVQPEKQKPSFFSNTDKRMWATFSNEWSNIANQGSEAIKALQTSRPVDALTNIGSGLLNVVGSPFEAVGEEIKEQAIGLTGNKEFGEKAKFLATAGLPLIRGGQIVNKVRPTNQAIDKLVDAIGPENLPSVIKRLESNPRLSVMDVSPAVTQDAQRLIIQQGKHQNDFIKAVEDRVKGARGAVENLYDEAMGAPIDVVKKIETLKTKARETGSKVINPVVEKTGAVDITNVVKAIDAAIGTGPVERGTLKALKEGTQPSLKPSPTQLRLWSEREKLRGIWPDKDQMFLDMKGKQGLHETQMALRAEAQSLLKSPNPLDHKMGNELMNVRNRLVEAGGKEYKEALGKYADDMSVQEAFQSGQNILKNNPNKIEDRPEFLREWIKKAKPDEIEALREGARVAVDNQIRSARNAALKGETIPEVEFNRLKLEMLFGKKEVDDLARKLNDERDIAKTTTKLVGGSETARRSASNERVDLPERKGTGLAAFVAPAAEIAVAGATGVPGAGLLIGAGQGASYLAHKGKTKLAQKTNEEYTKLLMSEGEARKELIETLKQYLPQPKQSILSRGTNALSKVIAP